MLVKAAEEWKESGEMGGRLVLSPHVAWFAGSSIEKLRRTVVMNVEAWARGEELNLVF
jgi:glycerate dehydrogenase